MVPLATNHFPPLIGCLMTVISLVIVYSHPLGALQNGPFGHCSFSHLKSFLHNGPFGHCPPLTLESTLLYSVLKATYFLHHTLCLI